MIAKYHERELAIKLRKEGLTYSEILEKVNVSSSSLSLWLRDIRLLPSQSQRIESIRSDTRKLATERIRQLRVERTKIITEKAEEEATMLINDPLWLSGLMLYWAEGTKAREWSISERVGFSNMDPRMVKLFSVWCLKYLDVSEGDLRYEIYIHKTGDINAAKKYWANTLLVKTTDFHVYLKNNEIKTLRKNIGNFYYGVARIRVAKSTDANRRIAAWTNSVVKYIS